MFDLRNPRWPRRRTWLILLFALLALAAVGEVRTSRLQSSVLTRYASELTYAVGAGPSSRIVFPGSGPHDEQLGYSRLPEFTHRLLTRGYRIAEQAQMSEAMAKLAGFGIAPPYREKASGGLVVRGASGAVMFDARPEDLLFKRYADVPPLVVESLLFIEDRELLQADRDHVRRALDHTGGQDPLGAVLAALFERHATDPAYRRTVLSTYLGAGLGADDSQQIHALITELARHPNSPTAGHPIDATQLFVLAQAVLGVARAITEHTTRRPGDLARLQADTRRLVEAYLAGLASQAR